MNVIPVLASIVEPVLMTLEHTNVFVLKVIYFTLLELFASLRRHNFTVVTSRWFYFAIFFQPVLKCFTHFITELENMKVGFLFDLYAITDLNDI